MSAFSNYAITESIPSTFLCCNPFITALTSPRVGSFTAISSTVSWTSSSLSSVIRFAGASLFRTSLACSVHLTFTSFLLVTRFPFLSRTVGLCLDLSLHSIFVSPYSVFICWLFAASSASSAMFYVYFLVTSTANKHRDLDQSPLPRSNAPAFI